MNSTNPAPGEGRLSFDSPEVHIYDDSQLELLELIESNLRNTGWVNSESRSEYVQEITALTIKLRAWCRAEHDARVAAEEELAAACLAQRLLARGNDAMFKEQLAAAESENAAFRKILKDIMHRCQQGDSLDSICYEVNEALAPAPTAEAAGSDASTEGRTT